MDPVTLTSVAANNATPSGPDTILLHLQEDAYQGDAQYTIAWTTRRSAACLTL